jgi:hypothetical protein
MPYKDPNDPRKKASAKKSSAKYYEGNKKKVIKANGLVRKKNRKLWNELKSKLQCYRCGFSHPAALDFHHETRSNHKSVYRLASSGLYKQAIREIQKCSVLCANCHRITHYEEKNPAL